MSNSNWAGVVKAYLFSENPKDFELARAALADLFAEAGDEEAAKCLRDCTVVRYAVPTAEEMSFDIEHGIEVDLDDYTFGFGSQAEARAFEWGLDFGVEYHGDYNYTDHSGDAAEWVGELNGEDGE